MDPTKELMELLARDKVRTCIERIARGEDRRDPAALKDSFWPDASTDFGIFSGSFDQYLSWIVPGSPAILATQHFLGQSLIEVDGTSAKAETHILSYHRADTGHGLRDITLGGRYLDRAECRNGVWRLIQRTMLYDWVQDFGTSADWSKGLMGTPFSAGHYTGRTQGDYSDTFFGHPESGPQGSA